MIFDKEVYKDLDLGEKSAQEAALESEEMSNAIDEAQERYLRNLYQEQYSLLKDIKRLSRETLIYNKAQKNQPIPKDVRPQEFEYSEFLLNAAENDLRINQSKIEMEFAKLKRQKPKVFIISDDFDEEEPEEKKLN